MADIRSTLGSKAAAATSAFKATETTVFVDVGARKIDANISRDGVAIHALPVDLIELDDFFAGRPKVTHKVVTQSIPAGTPVPVGSAIDLVLAEPGQIPVRIIEGVHTELRDRTLGSIYQLAIEDNADVRRVLARVSDPATLTPTDEAIVRTALNRLDIGISEEPGQTLDAAFVALKAGMTFGS